MKFISRRSDGPASENGLVLFHAKPDGGDFRRRRASYDNASNVRENRRNERVFARFLTEPKTKSGRNPKLHRAGGRPPPDKTEPLRSMRSRDRVKAKAKTSPRMTAPQWIAGRKSF
jgi:hypothetical protein